MKKLIIISLMAATAHCSINALPFQRYMNDVKTVLKTSSGQVAALCTAIGLGTVYVAKNMAQPFANQARNLFGSKVGDLWVQKFPNGTQDILNLFNDPEIISLQSKANYFNSLAAIGITIAIAGASYLTLKTILLPKEQPQPEAI